MTVVGLDLAGVETRPTGFCILRKMNAETSLAYTDGEIFRRIEDAKPRIIAIDAPLSLPPGRKSMEQKTTVHLRECDKELLRMGIKFFPVTLGPMRKLTSRGINLRRTLEKKHYAVIEVYPGGAQDILSLPRKQQGLEKLKAGLEQLGVKGLTSRLSDHELDAVTCALVAKLFLEGCAVTYGTPEHAIVMPKGEKPKSAAKHSKVKQTPHQK
jgi:predicted nuclease with RNAse H fold